VGPAGVRAQKMTGPQRQRNRGGAGSSLGRFYNRRALGWRGICVAWLALAAIFGTAGIALAEPTVSLDPAPDGTLILVGSGWRPGQSLVVSVGRDMFPALTDTVGEFEVQTGLVSTGGPPVPLAVHRPDAPIIQATLVQRSQPDTPHPLAILFAQNLLTGTIFLGLSAAGIGIVSLGARYVRARRRV
jgi:hypothetical protein